MVNDLPRLWLVFFSEGDRRSWLLRFMRPGFRHVCAAAWLPEQARWVYVDPTARGTTIEVNRENEFGPRFQTLLQTSTMILRVRSAPTRRLTPASFHCVGAIKALLGVRSRALVPFGLCRHLLANGAEIVPQPEIYLGQHVQRAEAAADAAGRPGNRSGTPRAAEAG